MTKAETFYLEMIWEPRLAKFRACFQAVLFASFLILGIAKTVTDFGWRPLVATIASPIFTFLLLYIIDILQHLVFAVFGALGHIFKGVGFATFALVFTFIIMPSAIGGAVIASIIIPWIL